MKNNNLRVTFVIAAVVVFSALTTKSWALSVEPSEQQFILGEPIVLKVNIENHSAGPIRCSLYPDQQDAFTVTLLKGDSHGITLLTPSPNVIGGGLQVAPKIVPGGKHTYDYFLESYVTFLKPGIYTFQVKLAEDIMVLGKAGVQPVTETASVDVNVGPADPQGLIKKAETVRNRLMAGEPDANILTDIDSLMLNPSPEAPKMVCEFYAHANFKWQRYMVRSAGINAVWGKNYLDQFSKLTSDSRVLSVIDQVQGRPVAPEPTSTH